MRLSPRSGRGIRSSIIRSYRFSFGIFIAPHNFLRPLSPSARRQWNVRTVRATVRRNHPDAAEHFTADRCVLAARETLTMALTLFCSMDYITITTVLAAVIRFSIASISRLSFRVRACVVCACVTLPPSSLLYFLSYLFLSLFLYSFFYCSIPSFVFLPTHP